MLQARPVPGPVQAVAPGSTPGWPVWARRPQRRQRPQLPRPEEAAAAQLAVEEGRGLRAWPPWPCIPCIVLRLTEKCPTRLCNAMIYHNIYYHITMLYNYTVSCKPKQWSKVPSVSSSNEIHIVYDIRSPGVATLRVNVFLAESL